MRPSPRRLGGVVREIAQMSAAHSLRPQRSLRFNFDKFQESEFYLVSFLHLSLSIRKILLRRIKMEFCKMLSELKRHRRSGLDFQSREMVDRVCRDDICQEVDEKKRNRVETVVIFSIALVLYLIASKGEAHTSFDGEGYYMYLPAWFIYDGFDDVPIQTPGYFPEIDSTGQYYNKYTFGVAIAQAPFFALACVYAALSPKYAVDGYSSPFQWFLLISALFYAALGCLVLMRVLKRSCSGRIAAVTLLCIFFGTSLLFYTIKEPGYVHAYTFFLWACLLWQLPRIYRDPRWTQFIILGLIISLLVFMRPSNIVVALLIPFWDVSSFSERTGWIRKHFLKVIILPLPFLALAAIQVRIWHGMLGETVLFSYQHEPGFIYLAEPKFASVLFHVHNGLLIYAPVLAISIAGLVAGIWNRKRNFVLIALILAVSTYIFASWWAWWFGGAYGHRCFIDLLPLLAIPMAYMFARIEASPSLLLKAATVFVCMLAVYYSIGMTEVYTSPWDGPGFGWSEYWAAVRSILPL